MNGGKATDTRHLGSTLFHAMLEEAKQFCEPCYNEDQHICQHQDREYHQVHVTQFESTFCNVYVHYYYQHVFKALKKYQAVKDKAKNA